MRMMDYSDRALTNSDLVLCGVAAQLVYYVQEAGGGGGVLTLCS